ncbi:Y-family DNA polymerase [Sinimarinibacterium thermocellulolyticum]|uniref:DNA polymerase Y family protein n=1 Tax=Sinimarinibacterium thermocellulolyticum TaxID=3170016 RepID=A0ABV2A7S6_9GAMM
MLWLCLHCPHLPAEALGLRDPLDAVTDGRGAQRWLITPGAGIAAGTALGDALARQPLLRAHARKPAAERAALKRLAHALYRYGSPVSAAIEELPEPGRAPRAFAWVEIGRSLRLFGGLDALRDAIRADLTALQQSAQLGIAPTRDGAALLALAGQTAPALSLTALEPRLAELPVWLLAWPKAQIDALNGMGLRRLGDLFALPRAGFARRFGVERLHTLDRLRGRVPDAVQAIVPPPVFRRRFALPEETVHLESLLFPLRRMSYELQGWLRARDTGVRGLVLECEHAHARRTRLGLRFVCAHRDGARLFDALRTRLEREALAAPVRALHLHATELGAVSGGQLALFDGRSDAQLQWAETVERLLARLGEHALWTPAVVEDHRPERATAQRSPLCGTPPGGGPGTGPGATAGAPERPLWLLPHPVALTQAPRVLDAVERIESGWWDGADARRDYHIADAPHARAWVYRDLADGRWYLHGWFA